MDQSLLSDLHATAKALKAAVMRSQNGVAGLISISKLGPTAMGASSAIFEELKQLESDTQRLLKAYRELLIKATATATEHSDR